MPTPVAEAVADAEAPEADNGSPEEGAEAKGQRGPRRGGISKKKKKR